MLWVLSVERVSITVLVDNCDDPLHRCISVWGLSLYVECNGVRLLFDTGSDPEILAYNARVVGVDLAKLDAIVLSHEHSDHIGGLSVVAEANKDIPVYIPKGMSYLAKHGIKSLGFKHVIEVEETTPITRDVAVIGYLYGPPHEQALAVNLSDYGLVVFVGCSHPGIVKIVEKAIRDLGVQVYAVIGGLHLKDKLYSEISSTMELLKTLGVKVVIPLHCSGITAFNVASKVFNYSMHKMYHVCSRIVFGKT
ncbi:MAG TPA: MBL fold metallo-hydrolase [Desulfurococcales archaeon]|nr:MBL fold metallo-hydrolase [Desulfurococcales archaeon]